MKKVTKNMRKVFTEGVIKNLGGGDNLPRHEDKKLKRITVRRGADVLPHGDGGPVKFEAPHSIKVELLDASRRLISFHETFEFRNGDAAFQEAVLAVTDARRKEERDNEANETSRSELSK